MATTTTERKKVTAQFSADEKAAARARVKEMKAAAAGADGEKAALAAIAAMPEADRVLAKRIHEIVKNAAPDLAAKTWYGMPAYGNANGVICFFKNASKFKTRYATFGFSDKANLDDGNVWPTEYAVKKLTPADEAKITALVKRAVG